MAVVIVICRPPIQYSRTRGKGNRRLLGLSEKPSRHAESRTIIAISAPLMAAYVAEMGMMITDMIIVGRLGANELAAVGLTADWFYVLLLIGMGVISIVGVLAAQSLGEGNRQGIIDASEQGMIVATISSVPVMLLVWYLAPALDLTGQDPDVIRLIGDYSRPLALSVLPALWFAVLRNFVTAMAKASIIMSVRPRARNAMPASPSKIRRPKARPPAWSGWRIKMVLSWRRRSSANAATVSRRAGMPAPTSTLR